MRAPFAVDDVMLPADLSFTTDPLGSLIIVQLDAGRIQRRCARDSSRFASGDVFINSPPDLPHSVRTRGVEVRSVVIDPLLLARVAGTASAEGSGSVRFTDLQPVSAAAAQWWKRSVRYLADALLADPDAAAHPLLIGNAARLLAATALTVFPNTAVTEPTAQDRVDGTSTVLRRAIEFIDSHAHTDVTLADIATAACVTPRAIQYAFRCHLDTTPMAYLRRVRLDRAHHDLVAGDPTRGDTVTTVAARWGFLHPGRFAARYCAAYGRSPGITLHT